MKAKLIKVDTGWILMVDNKIYASHNDILSLKNCEAIERGYDLDELAESYARKTCEDMYNQEGLTGAGWGWETAFDFKAGFQKALELMGDNKFSEDNVILIAEYIRVASQSTPNVRTKDLFDEYQSLQQTKWDVEVEMEDIFESNQGLGHNEFIKCKVLRVEGDNVYGEYIEGTKTNLDIPFSLSALNEIEGNSVGQPKLDANGCLILKKI